MKKKSAGRFVSPNLYFRRFFCFLGFFFFFCLIPASLSPVELSLEQNRAQRGNIGYVDMQRLFQAFPETARAKASFEEVLEKTQDQINLRQAEILRLKNKLSQLKATREALLQDQASSAGAAIPAPAVSTQSLSIPPASKIVAASSGPAIALPMAPAVSTAPAALTPKPVAVSSGPVLALPGSASVAALLSTATVKSITAPVSTSTVSVLATTISTAAAMSIISVASTTVVAPNVASSTYTIAQSTQAVFAALPGIPAHAIIPQVSSPAPPHPVVVVPPSISTAVASGPQIQTSTAAKAQPITVVAPSQLSSTTRETLADLDSKIAIADQDLRQKESDFDSRQAAAEKNLLDLESRKTDALLGKIHKAISIVAEREGISVVVDKSNLLYGHDAVDLTAKVLKEMTGTP